MDLKISKEKQIFLFFSMFFGIFVSFKKKIESLCLFNFMHMFTCDFIQYKYVLFHLNMLRLFQDINILIFFFEIKLVFKKNFFPTCLANLMFIHPNCFQNFNELKTRATD